MKETVVLKPTADNTDARFLSPTGSSQLNAYTGAVFWKKQALYHRPEWLNLHLWDVQRNLYNIKRG